MRQTCNPDVCPEHAAHKLVLDSIPEISKNVQTLVVAEAERQGSEKERHRHFLVTVALVGMCASLMTILIGSLTVYGVLKTTTARAAVAGCETPRGGR